MFTFQKGSVLFLTDGVSVGRTFLITAMSISQTFLEESKSVNTIHQRNIVLDTFTNSKSPVSVEFGCHLTRSDGLLFEWLGFIPDGNGKYTVATNPSLNKLDMYLITTTDKYKVSNAHLTTMSLQLSKSAPLTVELSAQGSTFEQVTDIPVIAGSSIQNSLEFAYGYLELVDSPTFGGITVEITRGVSWLSDRTVHDALSPNYHVPTRAVVDDLSISGTIVYYKTDDSLDEAYDVPIDITYADDIQIYLDSCRYFERWETGEVYKKNRDFKLLPSSVNAYIQF